jgi:preprotein translocase subunit SecE
VTGKKEADSSSSLDTVKLGLAVLILLLGLVGYYYFSDYSNLYRVLGVLAFAGVSVVIFARTLPGRNLLGYLRNSRTEVRKMVWPTRQEALQTTLIVVVLVMLIGIFLWLIDMFLGWAVKFVIGGA